VVILSSGGGDTSATAHPPPEPRSAKARAWVLLLLGGLGREVGGQPVGDVVVQAAAGPVVHTVIMLGWRDSTRELPGPDQPLEPGRDPAPDQAPQLFNDDQAPEPESPDRR
jgi:hypothetical protein